MVAHTYNPSTWEPEAGRFLSSRPAWSTKWVPGQPGLYRETLSRKTKKKKKKKELGRKLSRWKYLPSNLEDLSSNSQVPSISVSNPISIGRWKEEQKLMNQLPHHIQPENVKGPVLNKRVGKAVHWHPHVPCPTQVLAFAHINVHICSKNLFK